MLATLQAFGACAGSLLVRLLPQPGLTPPCWLSRPSPFVRWLDSFSSLMTGVLSSKF
ncbi:hypothetical protein ECANGB1_2634 [Enterospora canceri]|uniref:Uncharacterized protein n=1 Tax=Enterospora canceri TaxID=1081671 RepID=A0A1Y1S9A2_9MICR|nr:hypothetical protein ECANGB1_2634 [Enterospora canceri]